MGLSSNLNVQFLELCVIISSWPHPSSSLSQRTSLCQWLQSLHSLNFMNSLWPTIFPAQFLPASPSVYWLQQFLWSVGPTSFWLSFSLSSTIFLSSISHAEISCYHACSLWLLPCTFSYIFVIRKITLVLSLLYLCFTFSSSLFSFFLSIA